MPTSPASGWTATDLDLLQSMDAAGLPIDQMARRIGRDEAAIRECLPVVRARLRDIPFPGERIHHKDQDWHGPDEEGDVPLPDGRRADDPAAWVHTDPPEQK